MDAVDIVGIDLGTTNSAIAVWAVDRGEAVTLPNAAGEPLTRSVIFFDPDSGAPEVGSAAVSHLVEQPEAVVYSLKRFMGRTARDEAVADDRDHVTYDVEETDAHKLVVHVADQVLAPQQISSEILRSLALDARNALGRAVTRVVITVPAYFGEPQRQATIDAGRLAGLDVERLISEPTAAALAFGLGADTQTVVVYDLGGGTFDVSLLTIEDGVFRVRATDGDAHLGGDDLDRVIARWLADEYELAHGCRPADTMPVRARVREAARRAKVELSERGSANVTLAALPGADGAVHDLEITLSRARFEALAAPLIERTITICERLLERAREHARDVGQVLLVGGQTRTPAIKRAVAERFGWRVNDQIDPDHAVAHGAAVLGARLCGHLRDRFTLLDVTPLSIGIKLDTGALEPIVRANQQIPVTVWRRDADAFTTSRDGQTRVVLQLFQGERPVADDNTFVGELTLELATVRAAGEPRIHVKFSIDHDGILTMRAEEADADGTPVEARFDRSYLLSESEFEAHRAAAETHRAADERARLRFALGERLDRARTVAADLDRVRELELELARDDLEAVEAGLVNLSIDPQRRVTESHDARTGNPHDPHPRL